MTLPNFIVIGAAKAGTTSVYAYAAQHPEIYMSPVKETNYFALYGTRPSFKGPGDDTIVNADSVYERDRYEALFEGVKTEKAIGEASPKYIAVPSVAQRIRNDLPDCRIIAGLRQPADRAFASYVWSRMSGREPCRSFAEAIEKGPERRAANWYWGEYVSPGFYYTSLKRYFDLFPSEQIEVYLYDDLAKDSLGLMQQLFRFLDVDTRFGPDTNRQHNRSGVIVNPFLRKAWESSRGLRDRFRPIFPARPRAAAYRWVTRHAVKPYFDPELRQHLTLGYRADILKTQDLIGHDLSHWLEG